MTLSDTAAEVDYDELYSSSLKSMTTPLSGKHLIISALSVIIFCHFSKLEIHSLFHLEINIFFLENNNFFFHNAECFQFLCNEKF